MNTFLETYNVPKLITKKQKIYNYKEIELVRKNKEKLRNEWLHRRIL